MCSSSQDCNTIYKIKDNAGNFIFAFLYNIIYFLFPFFYLFFIHHWFNEVYILIRISSEDFLKSNSINFLDNILSIYINTFAFNWFRWENVLGDAGKQWVSCIQNHDILINNIFWLNYINSMFSFQFRIKIFFLE